MKRIYFAGLFALGSIATGFESAQAADVKIGVVQGLSGPPAIVDFGESYLQGIKLAVKDYMAAGGKHKIELVVYDDEATRRRRCP